MASFGTDRPDFGELVIERSGQLTTAYYVPTERARAAPHQAGDLPDRVRMADLDSSLRRLTIYPIVTLLSKRFMKPKYDQIARISFPISAAQDVPGDQQEFELVFAGLPRGFIKDFQYGLGIAKDYKVIVDEIEEATACTELSLEYGQASGISGDQFTMNDDDFEELRSEVDRITGRARAVASRVKSAHVFNWMAEGLGKPEVEVSRGKHPVTKVMADVVTGARTLDAADQDGLVSVAVEESRKLAKTRPEVLAKLKADIDLVALETLIERFEEALAANRVERHWQTFFEQNPFALHLAFGFTVIQVQSQASVGGRRLDGSGEKITDYLVKNPDTNNVGVFEIKRPKASLLRKKSYRDGVFAPTEELAGSVAQVLDQRYQLQRTLGALKESTRNYELEQYAIGCCLVIGRSPEGADEQKSFELFRHSLKDVTVVTYDELLEKLRQLRNLLATEEEPEATIAPLADGDAAVADSVP